MGSNALLSQLFIFGSRLAVVGVWPDADAAAWGKDTGHFDILRIHQRNEVRHDDVHAVVVEIARIAEAEEIKFQTLALYHLYSRKVAYANRCKGRLTCDRAKGGELRAVETYPVIVARVLVDKGFQYLWCIIHPVFGLGSESLQNIHLSVCNTVLS